MNIFYKKFLIVGLFVGHLGAMELPNAPVPMDYTGSSHFAIDQLPVTESEWGIRKAVEPIAAPRDTDAPYFVPVNDNEVSGAALSDDGHTRAIWLGAQDKIFINYRGTAPNSGASFVEPQLKPENSPELVDIHWVGDALLLVTRDAVLLFNPQTSAMSAFAFDEHYQLAAPMPGFKPSSLRCGDNELVFSTYSQVYVRDYLYRIMCHSNGDIRTVCKMPMKRLFFYSVLAASNNYTVVIKNAQALDDDTRNPKIKIFTTAQLDALSEEDHGIKKVVPAITHTLPCMPVDAVIFSPDEAALFVACMIKGEPSIIMGCIGKSTISFTKRYTAPAQVWNIFWPAEAEGPYISHNPDENKSSQLILKKLTDSSLHTAKKTKIAH